MGYCVSDHQNMCMGGCLSLDFLKKFHVFGHQPTDDPPGCTCSEYLKDISRSYRQHLTDSTQRTMRYAPAMKFHNATEPGCVYNTMPRESGTPLPRWARISRKRDEKEAALSAEEEECYLRTRLQLTMANRVDEALQSALKTNVSPVVDSIMTFFQKVSHNAISQERPNKRPRTASDEPLLTIFEMTPSQRYPETMLPLAMLHGPPSYLDRQETIKFIVTKMRHDKGKERPAVCWLRSAANSSSRHCGIFLQEILRQVRMLLHVDDTVSNEYISLAIFY